MSTPLKFNSDLVTLDATSVPKLISETVVTSAVTGHILAITDIFMVNSIGSVYTIIEGLDPHGWANDSLPVSLNLIASDWEVSQEVYDKMRPLIPGLENSSRVMACPGPNDGDIENNIVIQFGGVVSITVPMNDLIIPIYDPLTGYRTLHPLEIPYAGWLLHQVRTTLPTRIVWATVSCVPCMLCLTSTTVRLA